MKTVFILKSILPIIAIFLFCSFNVKNGQIETLISKELADWENCIREASGKIASSHSNSVLNVEYEYAKKNFNVTGNRKNANRQKLNVKLKIFWNSNNTNYSVEGRLSTNTDCCNVYWNPTNFSATVNQSKILTNLGCVSGNSVNESQSMGVGKPFVRRKSKSY